MELNAFKKREQILKLKDILLKGEEERINREYSSLDDVKKKLNNRIDTSQS